MARKSYLTYEDADRLIELANQAISKDGEAIVKIDSKEKKDAAATAWYDFIKATYSLTRGKNEPK